MKCKTCNQLIPEGFKMAGVYSSHMLGKAKLPAREANIFYCPVCKEIWNRCPKHGLYSAEKFGTVCPVCSKIQTEIG